MTQYRYRALLTMDTPADPGPLDLYPSTNLLVHAHRIGAPARDKFFPAEIWSEEDLPIGPGRQMLVTISLVDDDAPAYLGPGQRFELWGAGAGHGVISRRVFTDHSPT